MTGHEILDLPMGRNDAAAATVRDYLKCPLRTLWEEGECFSGKRPLGYSGWEHELYLALILGKACPGCLDADGRIEDIDSKAANKMILDAIEALR